MKLRIAALLAASLLVSGCSDISSLMNFPGDDDAPAAAAPAAVAAAPPGGPNAFCQSVATHDATENDFDTATKQKMARKSYSQCVALFSAN